MKHLLLKTWLVMLCLLTLGGGNNAWADTYVQLTSIASIDESAEYVLGIDGTGFHKSGTSSWGVCTNSGGGTPLKYKLVKATDGNSFKASTEIGSTTYYLAVPTSNTFTMATSSTAENTDMIVGTTQVSGTNYAVANKGTTARHLRLNGTSGLRSYAGTTGTMAFFYKVVPDGPTVSSISVKTAPTKTTYTEGEFFDPSGLVITKNLSDATTADVTYNDETKDEFTFNPSLETELSDETSVSITYGKKTTSQAITVNPFVATAGTYNIVPNNVFWGKSTQNGAGSVTANTLFGPVEKFGVTFEMNSGTSTNSYMKSDHSRAYNGYTLKLTAPSGFNLTAIEFTGSTWVKPTANAGAMDSQDSKKWTGEVGEVTFSFSGTSYLSNIKVTYEDDGGDPEKTATSLSWSAATATATINAINSYPTLTTDPVDLIGVTYSSSNTDVATINESTGEITLKTAGETTITASYAGDETYAAATPATYTLTVNAAPDTRTAVNMTGFSASKTTLVKDETTNTTVTNDQNEWTAAYIYESSNNEVATVNESGDITAVAKGTARITVSLNVDSEDENYKAGSTTSMYVDITVNNPSHIAHFSVNGTIDPAKDANVEEGSAITFPADPADLYGKKFQGWTKTQNYSNASDAPSDMTKSAIMGDADVTYYAVFAREEGSSEPQTITWNINGVATSASGGDNVNTVLNTSSVSPSTETGIWTAVASNSYAATSSSKAQLGSGSYKFAGTITLSGSSIPSGATISQIDLTATSSATDANPYSISATVDGNTFGTSQTLSSGNANCCWTGSCVGNTIVLTTSCGYNKNIVISALSLKYTALTRSDYSTTVVEPATLVSISATGTPAEFWKGDAFNHEGITVTATWSDESQTDVTSSCEFTGYNMSTPGQQTITVTYQGKTDTYDIEVKTIANTQETAYTIDEAIAKYNAGKDLTSKVYVKGTVSQIITAWSSQYNNITYAISDDGQTTSTQFQLYRCVTNGASAGDDVIAYGTLSISSGAVRLAASNEIVKIEKLATLSIADITVANGEDITPVITTNVAGEYAIEYTSNNDEVVLADGDELVTMGVGNATITATLTAGGYKTAETTFNVTVTAAGATLQSITLGGELEKTTYTIGDAFDRTGLVAIANYSDDSQVDVTDQATWEVDPKNLNTVGTVTVTVSASFDGQEDIQEYEVTVNKKTANITFDPATIEVEVGKNITLAPVTTPEDAVISYTITEGGANVSLEGAVVTGVAEGTATIRADFDGNGEYDAESTTVTINVIPADPRTTVTQTVFSAISGTLTDDINGEDTNLSYVAEKGDATTEPGVYSSCIRLYQNGGKITIKGVKGVHISSVSLTTGDTYETTTIAHVADPNDDTTTPKSGTSVAKNTAYTVSDLNCNSITFYCLGTDRNTRLDVAALSVKYTKEVIELSSIALSGTYKTEFVQNSTFNHDGVVVTATYSDHETQDVTASAVFSDPDLTTTGTKTITVSYTEGDVTKTATYDITVVAEEVTAIKLSGEYQTTFRVGDTFNHDKLVVKADYNSGRTNIVVTSNAEVSEPDLSTVGEKTVIVSFGGQSETYTIKVIPANTIFYESFDKCAGLGGYEKDDNTLWNGGAGAATLTADNNETGNKWAFAFGGGANKCAKFGNSSNKGAATTPKLGYVGAAIMTFKSAAWDGISESLDVKLSVVGGGTISKTSITNNKGEWTTYSVDLIGLTAESQITFEAANASNNRFFLDEVLITEAETFDLTVSDAGYATLCLPFNATIPAEATVYTGTYNSNGTVKLNEVEGGKIKAGEGYIVKAPAATYTFTITSDEVAQPDDNNLVGVTVRTQLTGDGSIYIFANQSKGVGFYKLGGDKTAYLAANKAYLLLPAGHEAREFVGFGDDTETGINAVDVVDALPMTDGKYLKDGKIVIVKNGVKYNVNGQRTR